MVDFTKASSKNLEEITKALEDMDSLDMELFNDSFKKSKSSTNIIKSSNTEIDGEIRKKVSFKDSNEDNLSINLPSDEEISVKEKKNLFSSEHKNSMLEDLFKIRTPVTSTSIKFNDELESKFNFEQEDNHLSSWKQNSFYISKDTTVQNETGKEKDVQKLKNIARNDEDSLANLIDNSDMVDSKLKRTSSIIRDSISHKPVNKVELGNVVQSINTLQELNSQTMDQSIRTSKIEPRRGRRNTKLINDPLGLLSTSLLPEQNHQLMQNETKDLEIQNTKTEENLPEWLGGSKKLEDKRSEKKKEETESISKQNIETHTDDTTDLKTPNASTTTTMPDHSQYFSMLFGTQFNQQAALANMQQQEHELKIATILSQQNDQLNKVSNTQYTMLHNQEEQFNALLKLQLERQALLENQIKLQQERINQYVHVLMAQPTFLPGSIPIDISCKSESNCIEKELEDEREELETTVKQLQVEKSKLEATLLSINERHNDEMEFQAEFYKRQIAFLREAMIKSEERTRQDIECLETDYITKVEKLRDEKQQIENQFKEEIYHLKNEHAQHIQEVCNLHSENIKILQNEYSTITESISKAKQIENQITETMTSRKTDIEDVLQKANSIIGTMLEHKEKLEIKQSDIIELREDTLKILEDNIKTQKLELKKQNSIFQEHHNQFIETTEKYNIHLTQLITELQKQNVLSNQTQEMFENKSTSLLHERELFEVKMKWEREYLQALKESWIKEQEKQVKLLAEEKEIIAAEKAQLEVLNKLKNSSDEIAKLELEAAIKVAQEATASANKEKLKWQEKVVELNMQKLALQDRENVLILHAKKLENFTQAALIKKEEGTRALKDAKQLENQNKERFNQLQTQFKALMEKERKVATEKYNVAKDRIVSLNYEHEKPERDTNTLYHFQNEILPFSDVPLKSQTTSELMDIDPNLIMLKLNINDEIDSTNIHT